MAEVGGGQPWEQLKLSWETRKDIDTHTDKGEPCQMVRGAAVAHDRLGLAYFNSSITDEVLVYDLENNDWSKLPKYSLKGFGLAIIQDLLTAVGGWSEKRTSNRLSSFRDGKWETVFPPMPTKRRGLTVISAQNYLIAVGGVGEEGGVLSTVEVMDTRTQKWYTAASLPEPVYDMTATVCGGRLYLLGGRDNKWAPTYAVFTCTLDSLIRSCPPPSKTPSHTSESSVWQRVTNVPVVESTCTTLNGRMLTVGGRTSSGGKFADAVHVYNPDSHDRPWQTMENMPTARSWCLVVGLRNCIIAVGGVKSYTTVEVGHLPLSDEVEVERHLVALELAMRKKGSLEKTIVQCVFVGPPRSGKSSLMKRIIGERPTPSSPSTGVADKVVQVEIVRSSTAAASVSGSTWVKLSHDDEAVTVVLDTAQSYSGQTAHSETHSRASVAVAPVNQTELNTTTLVSSVPEQRNQTQPHQSPSPATASTQPHLSSPSSHASTDKACLKPLAVDFCKSTLRRNPHYAVRASQELGWMVYLTDTGGQIEFQELLPLLVSSPSVFFLVFRLDRDLNKRFMVEYVRSTGTTSEPYQSNFTVKEALLQSLASIASMGTYVSRGEQVPLRSKVFFVGTHKDKVSQKEIKRIDRRLQQLVRSTGLYREGMIQFASDSQMLLAVNNLSRDDSDIELVRASVERMGSQGDFKVRAPPSWLIFSLTIRQRKERVLSYEQCFEVARECGIETREELNEALWFLHTRVGLIRYFQGEGLEDLQKIVIVDPQVIFDMNTDLVVETFTFDRVNPVIREYFKKKGIFPFSTFERISGSSEQLLTPSQLVKLLEHLHIIAPLEEEEDGERRYFMPCVLAHTMPAEATSLVEHIKRTITAVFRPSAEQTRDSSSLLIGFRCGYCPKGLFAALVVYLLAKTKSHFQWRLQRDRIFRDQISFLVGPYDAVSISVEPKFLEISCTSVLSDSTHNRRFPPAMTCGEVRRYIERGIREVTSALHYTSDAAHYLAFYCPGSHRGPDPKEPHPAEINFHAGVPCTLRCELAEEGTLPLPPGHEKWFTEGSECSGRQQQGRQSPGETALPSPPPPSSTAATGSGTTRPRIELDLESMDGTTVLDEDDLHDVRSAVADLSGRWRDLGVSLGIHLGDLEAILSDNPHSSSDCLLKMLSLWLKQNYKVERFGKPTWRRLVEAVKDHVGGNNAVLAQTIAREHPVPPTSLQ